MLRPTLRIPIRCPVTSDQTITLPDPSSEFGRTSPKAVLERSRPKYHMPESSVIYSQVADYPGVVGHSRQRTLLVDSESEGKNFKFVHVKVLQARGGIAELTCKCCTSLLVGLDSGPLVI
jgi:hypothetical protein